MYSENDIRISFERKQFIMGRHEFNSGKVLEADMVADGSRVFGIVLGQDKVSYKVSVDINYSQHTIRAARFQQRRIGSFHFTGHCTCGCGYYCNHVVAILFHGLELAKSRDALGQPNAGRLDQHLLDWLGRLARAMEEPPWFPEFEGGNRCMPLYVVTLECLASGRKRVMVSPQQSQEAKTRLGDNNVSVIRASSLFGGNVANHYDVADKVLLGLLWTSVSSAAGGQIDDQGLYPLAGDLSGEILRLILESGRGRWGAVGGPTLVAGVSRSGRAYWVAEADGTQQFRVDVGGGGAVLLPLTKPWYVDTRTGEIGPLEVDLPSDLLQVLSEAPPVPTTVANFVRRNLERKLTAQSSFLPQDVGSTAPPDVTPTLCLRLVVQVEGPCSLEENENDDEAMYDCEGDDLEEIGDEYVDEEMNVTLLAYLTFDYFDFVTLLYLTHSH
ncbi:MAG: hypothetical protein WCJ64_17675 [Rhodospirillaceae bacterium]